MYFDRVNNLCHQHGDMHIAPTVSFARIYANITKWARCIKKSLLAQNMSILVLFFTKNAISIRILIIVDTATDYPQTVCVTKYKHRLSKCLNILCVSEAWFFQNTDSSYIAEFCALNEYPEFHKIMIILTGFRKTSNWQK